MSIPNPKSIIKKKPSIFLPRENKEDRKPSRDKSPKRDSTADGPRPTPHQLAVPTFFGGSSRRYTANGHQGHHNHVSSLASIGSYHSSDSAIDNGHHVRFLDRLSVRSISAIHTTASSINDSWHYAPDGDLQLQLHLHDIQDDPNYLPGFVDLYYSTEITIREETCCCSTITAYNISDQSGKMVYSAEKEADGVFSSLVKFFCLSRHDLLRTGFSIKVFNTTVKTKLLTFRRKTHWAADQLDIVETYYSLENSHVGRIEKTKEGFRLIDQRGRETYRVIRESKQERTCLKIAGTLVVFSCETRKVAAKISYIKRKCFGTLCSLFMNSLHHKIKWSAEIGVTMKILLLGVLFLELHSNERFVDLPLGRDANITMNSTKHRLYQ